MLSGYTRSTIYNIVGADLGGCQLRLDIHAQNAEWPAIKPDGGDIRFTLADDTLLPHWVERFDYANKVAMIWVRLPATQPATVLLQYGNGAASSVSSYANSMQKKQVDANTIAAYYFDNQTGADENGLLAATVTGMAWGGADAGNMGNHIPIAQFAGSHPVFNGTSGRNIEINGLLNNPPAAVSISFWMRPSVSLPRAGATAGQRIFGKVNTLGPDNFIEAYVNEEAAGGVDNGRIFVRMAVAGTLHTIKSRRVIFNAARWYQIIVDAGALGLRIWVNGILEYRDASVTSVFGGGSNDSFRFGSGYLNTNNFSGAMGGLVVDNRQMDRNEVWARFQRRKYHVVNTQSDKWVKGGQVFGDTAGRPQAGEASAIVVGSTVHAYYAEANNPGTEIFQVHSSSSNGTAWTTGTVLLGGGTGGETGDPLRNTIYVEAGVYYLYYPVAAGSGKDLFVATASNPAGPFTKQNTAALLHDSVFQFIENPDLKKIGGTYVMMIDGAGTAGVNYPLRIATASNPLGPFTFVSASVLQSLKLGTGEGHAVWRMIAPDGGYHVFYHAEEDGVLPGHTYYARSHEASLSAHDNMIPSAFGPVRTIETSNLYIDQWTDVTVFEFAGNTYMLRSEADNNGEVTARIQQDTYTGNLQALVNEGIYNNTVASGPTVKIMSLSAGKLLMRNGKLIRTN